MLMEDRRPHINPRQLFAAYSEDNISGLSGLHKPTTSTLKTASAGDSYRVLNISDISPTGEPTTAEGVVSVADIVAGCEDDAGAGCEDDAGAGCEDDAGAGCEDDAGAGCEDDAGAGCEDDAGAGCEDDAGAGCEDDAGAGCEDDAGPVVKLIV